MNHLFLQVQERIQLILEAQRVSAAIDKLEPPSDSFLTFSSYPIRNFMVYACGSETSVLSQITHFGCPFNALLSCLPRPQKQPRRRSARRRSRRRNRAPGSCLSLTPVGPCSLGGFTRLWLV